MGSFSDYAENKILDHSLGQTSWTMPSAVAIALTTSAPTDASTGASMTEVSNANAYARFTVTPATHLNAASSGSVTNKAAMTFPTCTTSTWGTIQGFCVVDSATYGAGNVICWGTLGTNKTIGVGDTASFAIGDFQVTLD